MFHNNFCKLFIFSSHSLPKLYYVIMNLTHSCVYSSLSWSLALIISNTFEAVMHNCFFLQLLVLTDLLCFGKKYPQQSVHCIIDIDDLT